MKASNLVAIGLRAKTGRAIAVVVGGTADSPLVLAKTEIKLCDPKFPATGQPYHHVMDLPGDEWPQAVQKSARAIERIAVKSLATLMKEQAAKGREVRVVATVGAKDRDLARIGNPHIRAHAAEGILFRRVLDNAAQENGLSARAFAEREFDQILKQELGMKSNAVKKKLDEAARALPPPWRADEKLAAMAAWLVLREL
ncbi:MAG TPA: hypothetical protein VNG71_10570 [Pyrinomonadaceae bacterium]|nr:hypothetical protein [Pyrinomonadaceae bacterium]